MYLLVETEARGGRVLYAQSFASFDNAVEKAIELARRSEFIVDDDDWVRVEGWLRRKLRIEQEYEDGGILTSIYRMDE